MKTVIHQKTYKKTWLNWCSSTLRSLEYLAGKVFLSGNHTRRLFGSASKDCHTAAIKTSPTASSAELNSNQRVCLRACRYNARLCIFRTTFNPAKLYFLSAWVRGHVRKGQIWDTGYRRCKEGWRPEMTGWIREALTIRHNHYEMCWLSSIDSTSLSAHVAISTQQMSRRTRSDSVIISFTPFMFFCFGSSGDSRCHFCSPK